MIEHYSFGLMIIDGQHYKADLKIFPDHILSPWWRKEGHVLNPEDISDVLQAKPAIFIVGNGFSGYLKVHDSLRRHISEQGIILIVEHTGEAWKTYNKASSNQKVIGAFHLTC